MFDYFWKFVSDWICLKELYALRVHPAVGAVNTTVRVGERDGKAGGDQCVTWRVDGKFWKKYGR